MLSNEKAGPYWLFKAEMKRKSQDPPNGTTNLLVGKAVNVLFNYFNCALGNLPGVCLAYLPI